MIIRLYIDEDAMDTDLVRALRARGADVITANDAAMIERPDEEHLAYATTQGRILYSFNKGDYYRLHTELLIRAMSHSGIVLADHRRYSVGEQMRRLLKLIASKSAEDMENQVEFLSAWG